MAWLNWAVQRVGYVVRPYDMLADRRRWFWQPRQPCGWSRVPTTTAGGECQGADFSKVAAALAAGVEEHIRRDNLPPIKAALFRSRGGHAPGETCPSNPNPEPIHDQGCELLYDGEECTCGAWPRQAPRNTGS